MRVRIRKQDRLVLSLFPGIGLLDRAFELEGFCVVRGPDLLWGGDIRLFHPPSNRFDGAIGGPPCQRFSRLSNVIRAVHGEESLAPNLIPEFERVVLEAMPRWFVMENVEAAPLPQMPGFDVQSIPLNNRWLGEDQNRLRRFSFGSRSDIASGVFSCEPDIVKEESPVFAPVVCSSWGGRRAVPFSEPGKRKQACLYTFRSIAEEIALQGLPPDFLEDAPFTSVGKRKAIGNGVPIPMGRAIARAVKRAISTE